MNALTTQPSYRHVSALLYCRSLPLSILTLQLYLTHLITVSVPQYGLMRPKPSFFCLCNFSLQVEDTSSVPFTTLSSLVIRMILFADYPTTSVSAAPPIATASCTPPPQFWSGGSFCRASLRPHGARAQSHSSFVWFWPSSFSLPQQSPPCLSPRFDRNWPCLWLWWEARYVSLHARP
jgi:hypothetical protein